MHHTATVSRLSQLKLSIMCTSTNVHFKFTWKNILYPLVCEISNIVLLVRCGWGYREEFDVLREEGSYRFAVRIWNNSRCFRNRKFDQPLSCPSSQSRISVSTLLWQNFSYFRKTLLSSVRQATQGYPGSYFLIVDDGQHSIIMQSLAKK